MLLSHKTTKYTIIFILLLISLLFLNKYRFTEGSPNIIIISLDALRADHMGCYGYEKNTTPNINKLSSDSVIFDSAYCPEPFTLTSHMSLFTGLYPETHSVQVNKIAIWEGMKKPLLSKNIPTLTEILKKDKYMTAGYVFPFWLDEDFGFSRGFDSYNQYQKDLTYADRINKDVSNQLINFKGKDKFYLFLHYFDIHNDYNRKKNRLPYYSPIEFRNKFISSSFNEKDASFSVNKRLYADKYLNHYSKNNEKPMKEEHEYVIGLYDAGIAYTDYYIGDLINKLKELGYYDNSLIVITSDHGEEFLEHGEYMHNQVYEECIRIPLLIKFPHNKYSGKRVNQLVEIIDIMPTILDYLHIKAPIFLQGKSTMNLINSTQGSFKTSIYSNQASGHDIFCIRTKNYKLIYDTVTKEGELYDLQHDPSEKYNIYKDNEITEQLKKKLLAWLTKSRKLGNFLNREKDEPEKMDEEYIKEIKALGYLQ